MNVFDILREKIKEKYEKVNPYVEKNVAEIINEVEKEFATDINVGNNGWIPCSKKLPNEEEMVQAYCRNHYGSEFIVMIDGADKPTTLYRTIDGFWVDDEREVYNVIAWQPLPPKYEPKGGGIGMENQCKCGSLDFFMKKQGNNTGLYCSMCGKWKKWMNKDEIRLFEHNHKSKKRNAIKQTNADRIRAMSDEELAMNMMCPNENGLAEIECNKDDNCNCYKCILEWLQKEVK